MTKQNPPKSLVVHEPDLDIDIEVTVKIQKKEYDAPVYSLFVENQLIGRIARRDAGISSMIAWYDEDYDSIHSFSSVGGFVGFTFDEAVAKMVSKWTDRPASNPTSLEQIRLANKTARVASAVGMKAITPRYVADTVRNGESVLNFGAGKPDKTGRYLHSDMVSARGAMVSEFDFGSNTTGALGDQYDTVFASNVLNVQSSEEMLLETLVQIRDSMKPDGRAVFNYPLDPRYLGMTSDDVAIRIAEVFRSWPRIVGGNKKAPLWEVTMNSASSNPPWYDEDYDSIHSFPYGHDSLLRMIMDDDIDLELRSVLADADGHGLEVFPNIEEAASAHPTFRFHGTTYEVARLVIDKRVSLVPLKDWKRLGAPWGVLLSDAEDAICRQHGWITLIVDPDKLSSIRTEYGHTPVSEMERWELENGIRRPVLLVKEVPADSVIGIALRR